MNKSQLFKQTHALTKATVKAGDNYQATFALCLKAVYAQSKESSIVEKLIAAGGKVWEKSGLSRIYLSQEIADKCDFGIRFNDKKHKLFFDMNANKFGGTSETFTKVLNSKI